MIMRFLKRIPAGMMVVPLLIGCIINTFFPNALQIGGLTTALFSSQGASTTVGILLFCMGTTLRVKDMPTVIKRGGVLLLSKFAIGTIIGLIVGKCFGTAGVLGISSMAIICAMTNSNGSIFFSLMSEYGDKKDCACQPILALNDGPFFTLLALGASGMGDIPFMSLLAAIIPVVIGFIIGNLDEEMAKFFGSAVNVVIPFSGFSLGAGIDLQNVLKGGVSGIILAFVSIFIGGGFIAFCDHFINKRPGYAGWGIATTAGNAVAVPAVIALADSTFEPYASTATVQVATCVVLSAILVPFIVNWWAKKFGSPQYPLDGAPTASTETECS